MAQVPQHQDPHLLHPQGSYVLALGRNPAPVASHRNANLTFRFPLSVPAEIHVCIEDVFIFAILLGPFRAVPAVTPLPWLREMFPMGRMHHRFVCMSRHVCIPTVPIHTNIHTHWWGARLKFLQAHSSSHAFPSLSPHTVIILHLATPELASLYGALLYAHGKTVL